MKSNEIREAFLSYFEKNGHTRVRSAPLVPNNDPTLFFTNAGMVQFKEVFTGDDTRDYRRACSSQKCMRVSGKHNDLENVGHTPRHHTFFEMLGNFSFGDYFKKEAIAFGWEFLTKVMGLDGNKICITIFRDDDEAEKFWKAHIPSNRIFRLDEKDNFWAMGDTGPCGPCSEIMWDFGSGPIKKEDFDTDRFMEIWNLVFMQFNRSVDGTLTPLGAPSIDTGMGLERLSAVIQGVRSNWETDLFQPIIGHIATLLGTKAGASDDIDVALRVIADHIRCSTFLIGDGVLPSNEGRGYVLRRIMRRAIRFGKRLGQSTPFMSSIVDVVMEEMGGAYPELATHEHFIKKVIGAEEERFLTTLDKGLELLKEEMGKAKEKTIDGEVAFKLYDTFGFPLDVTAQIAAESGFVVDEAGFNKNMEMQRERARASWKGSGEEAVGSVFKGLSGRGIESKFIGYTEADTKSKVLAIIHDGKIVDTAKTGEEVGIVTEATPFYGASGGQVGDIGIILADATEVEITSTEKPLPDLIVHMGKVVDGSISKGMMVTLAIDEEIRQRTRLNHTATHLLHKVLREVLGEHVKQAGSLVTPEKMRFDFSHYQALTHQEIMEVERKVNFTIRRNLAVETTELSYDEAVAKGAMALFGEKYGEKVRMVNITGFSMELCGGTHVKATGDIGLFKIVAESSVAAGVRRIEALTGLGAMKYLEDMERDRLEIATILKSSPAEIIPKTRRLIEEVSRLEREIRDLKNKSLDTTDITTKAKDKNGIKILAVRVDYTDKTTLANMAEKYRDKLGKSVVVLGTIIEDKAAIVVAVSKDLTPSIHAGKIVSALSEGLCGKGGGRPDFAQGGGVNIHKLDEVIKKVYEMIG